MYGLQEYAHMRQQVLERQMQARQQKQHYLYEHQQEIELREKEHKKNSRQRLTRQLLKTMTLAVNALLKRRSLRTVIGPLSKI